MDMFRLKNKALIPLNIHKVQPWALAILQDKCPDLDMWDQVVHEDKAPRPSPLTERGVSVCGYTEDDEPVLQDCYMWELDKNGNEIIPDLVIIKEFDGVREQYAFWLKNG
jgi:hypothetical protein